MPLLTIENLPGATLEVPAGASLLAALHNAGFDWMHACGGRGRCITCRLQVQAGAECLGALTAAETRYRNAGRLRPDERLACQAQLPVGAVRGRVLKATQLPHQHYAE